MVFPPYCSRCKAKLEEIEFKLVSPEQTHFLCEPCYIHLSKDKLTKDKTQVLQAMQELLKPQRGHTRRVLTRLIRELDDLRLGKSKEEA